MNCIIVGDKYQKGMKSKGCSALMRTGKRGTLLNSQYEILNNSFDHIPITYIYGFDSKRLLEFVQENDYRMDMVYNENHDKYNESFSVNLASDKLDDETLIVLGYQTLTPKTFKKFNNLEKSGVFISGADHKPKVGCVILDNNITTLNFDLDNPIHDIYYLNRECSAALKELLQTQRYHNYFLFELLNKLIDKGLQIRPIL